MKNVFKERSRHGSRPGYVIYACSELKEVQLTIWAIQKGGTTIESSAQKFKYLIIDRASYINPFSVQSTFLP